MSFRLAVPPRSADIPVRFRRHAPPPHEPDEFRKVLSPKAAAGCRTYSPSKVIHRGRGELPVAPSQLPGNNFGGATKMSGEQLRIWLNREVEHAGPGRRIPHSSGGTLTWRVPLRDPAPCRQGILRTLRLQAQTWQRRTSISASIRQGRRARHTSNQNSKYEHTD
jgi:hypothetical protein